METVNTAIISNNFGDKDTSSTKLNTEWCKCREDSEFLCYPQDGECSCGLYQHHVHCICGSISQVG